MASNDSEIFILGIDEISDYNHLAFISSYVYSGKRFDILVADDPPAEYRKEEEAIEMKYLKEVDKLSWHDGTDHEVSYRQVQYHRQVALEIGDIALPTFQRIAPPSADLPLVQSEGKMRTVQEHLYPEHIKLQLVTIDGHLAVIEGHHTENEDPNRPIPFQQLKDIIPDLESISAIPASETHISSTRYNIGSCAYDASVRGEERVCKILVGLLRNAFAAELGTLMKIQTAGLGEEARTSKLQGIVTHGDGVVGLILEKIPTKIASLNLVIQGKAGEVPQSSREKWADQIEHTVIELHKKGIIWGDAKPDNVVIDERDNAWLIDFGGGFTEPWVDRELYESCEGDLKAVERIKEKLRGPI